MLFNISNFSYIPYRKIISNTFYLMNLPRTRTSNLSRILIITLILNLGLSAIAPLPTVTQTTTSTSGLGATSASSGGSSFATPTMNFDFSSMLSQSSAQSSMDQARSSWSSFFDNRSKPVFSEQLTNVVQGSDNQLRGTQN